MNIKEIQTRLKQLGYYNGFIDGDFGPMTDKAVRSFQEARGLQIDGRVGPITLSALLPPSALISEPLLTAATLNKIFPKADPAIVQGIIDGSHLFKAAGITTKMRMAHWLAQVGAETGGLRQLEENLNYSVEGLINGFGRHRISIADAQKYGRKPGRPANQEAIANILYGGAFGRKELGNTQPGDGWQFRGSGLKQTTGRANHREAGHENDPEALRSMPVALEAALVFWMNRHLNDIADRDDVEAMTRKVNGGVNGLDDRKLYLKKAKAVLGV